MKFSSIDFLNLIALLISIIGSFMMFYYTPKIRSSLFIYNRSEMEAIYKQDLYKNKMVRIGMLFLLIGFLLQAIAIFLNASN